MDLVQITNVIGAVMLIIYTCLRLRELKEIKKDDPQYYIKRTLLRIEMWVIVGVYFIFLKHVVIALAV